MMRFKLSWILLGLLGIGCVQSRSPLTSTPREVSFASEEAIALDATLDGKHRITLALHSGVSDVSLERNTFEELIGPTAKEAVVIQSWGGKATLRRSEHHDLSFGIFDFQNLSLFECEQSSKGTVGKIGMDMFGSDIIELDFVQSKLRLHTTLPAVAQRMTALPVKMQRGLMMIPAQVIIDQAPIDTHFMLHTGFAGSILLSDEFAFAHLQNVDAIVKGESSLSDSLGNVLRVRNIELPELRIAGTSINNVSVGIFDPDLQRQPTNVLGLGIFRKFHVFIDWQSAILYLKPNPVPPLEKATTT